MEKNNFKMLMEEDEINMPTPSTHIENNLNTNMRTFKFIGNIVDLYFPKVINTMMHLAGSDDAKKQNQSTASAKDITLPPNL